MTPFDEGPARICINVDPGVCRFRTKIIASYSEDCVCFEIISDCPHVKKVQEGMPAEFSPFDALRMPFSANPIYEVCGKALAHSACPIPSALIKAAEAASGLGLKRNVHFEFEA